MSFTPVSRETLRGLKAKKDEETRILLEKQRLAQVDSRVKEIYRETICYAGMNTDTRYIYGLPPIQMSRRNDFCLPVPQPEFHRDNMEDILSELRVLFPDCSVKYTKVARGEDGKFYDISSMDEKIIAVFIDKRHNEECIIIDWT
jgi:hypothetical protein